MRGDGYFNLPTFFRDFCCCLPIATPLYFCRCPSRNPLTLSPQWVDHEGVFVAKNTRSVQRVNIDANEVIAPKPTTALLLLGSDEMGLGIVAYEGDVNGYIIVTNQHFCLLFGKFIFVESPKNPLPSLLSAMPHRSKVHQSLVLHLL